MELPGLSLLQRDAPELARQLESRVRRLVTALDAQHWAAEQVAGLVAAHGRGELLPALVDLVRAEAGGGEVWAVVWTGPDRSGFRALAGRGEAPPEPRILSRTLLGAVARADRPVWLTEGGEVGPAPSLVVTGLRARGAVPLGTRGLVYLAGRADDPAPTTRARLRIEALCLVAAGFLGAEATSPPRARPIPGLVGDSPAMAELARAITAFAAVPWPALVLGETGTGKELVARALHELGPRKEGPFVAVNCAAIPDELAESTLFGHERGSFTGAERRREGLVERANGGTLFLDEVGELPPRVQPKLLRLLQEGSFERVGGDRELRFTGRIVAATLREVQGGSDQFREDLYHRLGACVLHVPPLRERREDVRPLARHLLARAAAELGQPLTLDEDALRVLEQREWRGNVRELDNTLKRALATALARRSASIGAADLGAEGARRPAEAETAAPRSPLGLPGAGLPGVGLPSAGQPGAGLPPAGPGAPSPGAAGADAVHLLAGGEAEPLPAELLPAVERLQRFYVRRALAAESGHRPRAAARLGVTRQWLHTLLSRWGEP